VKSSLKIKLNQKENEFSVTTADGYDLLKGLFITNVSVEADATHVPKVVLTCVLFDGLEIETDEADIEIHETKVRK
jgi:hypothetical protein